MMNRRLFLLCVLAVSGDVALGQAWGTLKGRFVFEGKVPALVPIAGPGLAACGKPPPREEILVDKDGGLANVAVYVLADPKDINNPVGSVHPKYAKKKETAAVLDNNLCRFEPRVLAVWTEQKFTLKNTDPFPHNSFGSPWVNKAFNPVLPPGANKNEVLDKAEKTPFAVTCSMHPWMKAYVLVRPDPYMAVSATTGEFKIEDLPVGEHTFQFWHESLLYLGTMNVGGKDIKDTRATRGQHKFTIKAGENDVGRVVLKAADYDAAMKKIPK